MPRLKVEGQAAVYHCITRVVGGQFLLDDLAKEKLRAGTARPPRG